jgi:peptidyl-prolyl cis-trans isomerase B (cyclophilin B)
MKTGLPVSPTFPSVSHASTRRSTFLGASGALLALTLVGGCNSGASSTGAPVESTSAASPATPSESAPQSAAQPVAAASDTSKASAPTSPSGGKTYVVTGVPAGAPDPLPQAYKAAMVPPPPANFKAGTNPRVKFTTGKGSFIVQLNSKEAPLHAKSFVYLAKRGFYNNTILHRWDDLTGQGGNIIQGGDPFTRKPALRDYFGRGGPGYSVPRERNALKHTALVIAAARTSDPDSAGSQFYITQAPVSFLDDGDGYTVFGKVVSGGDIAKKLRQGDALKRVEVVK